MVNCIYGSEHRDFKRYLKCHINLFGGRPSPNICNHICKKRIEWSNKQAILDDKRFIALIPRGLGIMALYEYNL
jgi:hypothetical protein